MATKTKYKLKKKYKRLLVLILTLTLLIYGVVKLFQKISFDESIDGQLIDKGYEVETISIFKNKISDSYFYYLLH